MLGVSLGAFSPPIGISTITIGCGPGAVALLAALRSVVRGSAAAADRASRTVEPRAIG